MQLAPENKLANVDREQLLDRLLRRELDRNPQFLQQPDHEAVRARAREELATFDARRDESAPLVERARDLVKKRDAAKAEFEALTLAAETARDALQSRKTDRQQRLAMLANIANASSAWLRGKGLDTVEALNQMLRLRQI